MTSPRTGRRGLARIIAASIAVGALALPITAGSAAAASTGTAVAQATPPGDDAGTGGNTGGSTDPDPETGGNNGDTGGNTGGSTDPDPDTGGNNGGTGGNNGGAGNNNGGNNGGAVTPRPTGPSQQELEEKRKAEEQRKKEQEAAKDAAEAARKAEEKRQKEILRQQREAAERAEQAAKARQSWLERGQPRQMVTVRTDRVEVVDGGRLTTLQPRRPGALSLKSLDSMLPGDWITIDGDTAKVSTAIVLTPGVSFEISDIPTVQLTGGPDVPDASAIYTGGGRLVLKNTLAGVDRGGQQLPFEAVGRPFIEATNGGEIDVTDVTITDMGVPAHGQATAEPAISFNPGSTGSVVRTTLQRNNIGLEVSGARGVQLDGVTASESESDGIILNGDQGTRMANLRAEKNGGNGMWVGGEDSDRPISGVTTLNNKLYGLVVTQAEGTQVSAISTEADEAGGLRLNQAKDVTVTDFAATDQPIGIFTHVGSTGIVLDNIRTNGGRRGVVVEKSTKNLELKNSTIEGSRVAGVNVGGKDIRVNGVQVSGAKSAFRLERGSAHVQLNAVKLDGGRDGIVASAGMSDLVINDLEANAVEDDTIRTASPDTKINGGTISGGTTALDIAGAATITAVTINGSSEGLHARSTEPVRAENVAIDATDLGLNVAPGTPFVLANSSVHALEAVRGVFAPEGTNNISLPPLNLLAAMGVPLILLAIVLEQVHSFRQRRVGGNRRHAPPAIPVGAN
jgi:hypothetical protein